MNLLKPLFLLLVAAVFTLSSCKDEETDLEIKKGFLTAHTWKIERVSYNGSVNLANTFPETRYKFNADGSYSRININRDGSRFPVAGKWELNKDATRLTFIEDTMRATAPIRELTAKSLKMTRDDAPDIILEFDFVPE